MRIPVLRAVIRRIVFWCATVWLVVEALRVLEATFEIPYGVSHLVTLLERHGGVVGFISQLFKTAWPLIFLVLVAIVRQEAHRWFRIRRGRKSADRLITGWFTLIGTLLVVDLLSDVKLVLPHSAIEASLFFLFLYAGSWCSRIAYLMSRKALCRTRLYRTTAAVLRTVLSRIVPSWGKHTKGGRNARPKTNHRRAA